MKRKAEAAPSSKAEVPRWSFDDLTADLSAGLAQSKDVSLEQLSMQHFPLTSGLQERSLELALRASGSPRVES